MQADYLHKLFRNLLHRRFLSSPPFMYLFTHLFRAVWARGYLFSTLVVIQYYFILLLTWFVRQELSPCVVLTYGHRGKGCFYFCFCFCFFLFCFCSFSSHPCLTCIHTGQHAAMMSGTSMALSLLFMKATLGQLGVWVIFLSHLTFYFTYFRDLIL